MNIYLYGGSSRRQASKSITPNNEQVEIGKTYKIDYRVGFLLIAYPNKDKIANLEFKY